MAASANGHLRCLRALVEGFGDGGEGLADGEMDAPDNEGRTALMHACMFDQVQLRRQGIVMVCAHAG